jgi:hypothetical protein
VREHTRYCRKYKELYATRPKQALDPEDEFIRWRDGDRAGERDDRRQAAVDEADRRRAVQAGRWATPPDILEE